MAQEGFYRAVAHAQFGSPRRSAETDPSHVRRVTELAASEGRYGHGAQP